MSATLREFLGDWSPASTTVCVNSLSTPGARIEIDVIAAFPKR
jgi:2-iminobutanoate/2-iminopropanoate deaminase